MEHELRIVHLEDDLLDAELIEHELRVNGIQFAARRAVTKEEFIEAIENFHPDLILSDFTLPGLNGYEARKIAETLRPGAPFIFVSGTIGEEVAIEALKEGATDYVLKDRLPRLGPVVRRALREVEELRELQRAEDRLRFQADLLRRAREAIYVRDPDGTVVFWNEGAELLYGWLQSEAIGKPIAELVCPARSPVFAEPLARTLATGEWSGELPQVTRTGRPILVESRWSLIPDHQGASSPILVLNADITERRALESQALRAQRLESIATLAGGVAHELNNALSPSLLALEMLAERVGNPRTAPLLETISGGLQRATSLVRQLLTFARGPEIERQEVDAPKLLHDLKVTLSTFPKNIHIHMDVPAGLWNFHGDATQIFQVLLNLCLNARDAMPEGGKLTVIARNRLNPPESSLPPGLAEGPRYIEIAVQDTGNGIPPALREKIFEPFFTTKRLGQGTGLGLSCALTIVRSHHGRLDVASTPGDGSTFTILLPASHDEAPAATPPHPPRWQDHDGQRRTILIVDDEPDLVRTLAKILDRLRFRVLTATDGEDAIKVYRDHRDTIDAVILDYNMPRLDGMATARELTTINPAARIILSTGMPGCEVREALPLSSFSGILPKPFTSETLRKTLQDALTPQSA